MHHRYGRHGPRAWIHWEIGRLERFSCSLVGEVVEFVLPAEEAKGLQERKVIVHVNESECQIVKTRMDIVNIILPPLDLSKFPSIKYLVNRDSREKAQWDLKYYDRESTEAELQICAKRIWERRGYAVLDAVIRDSQANNNVSDEEIEGLYVAVFSTSYREVLEKDSKKFPDENIVAVRDLVRDDRTWNKQNDIHLEESSLRNQAAVRVFQQFNLDIRTQRDLMNSYIEEYITFYKELDLAPTEEGGGQDDKASLFRR